MRRRMWVVGLAAAGVVVGGLAPVTAASGPVPVFDYTMPDNIGPLLKVLPANGPVPEYDFTGKFVPETPLSVVKADYGATNYGEVPDDGRYRVNLDACASTVGANPIFEWTIGGVRKVADECKTNMRLPEGLLDYTLRVIDSQGSASITGKLTVKNVLLAITGDSYSSGEGFPPLRKPGNPNQIAWDFDTCSRSRWSGFVRSAAQLEAADPRSNVTVLDVACSGATVPDGILGPQNGLPSQIQQLNDLRKGQPIDQLFLSIGGNDIGFSDIILTCLTNLSATKSCFQDLAAKTNTKLENLVQRYANTAACLNDGDCKVTVAGAKQSEPALQVPAGAVIQTAYPNLLAGPASPDGFPANTNPDALCNVNWAGAPLRYGDSWWGYNVVIQGTQGRQYEIPKWTSPIGTPGQQQNPPAFVDFTPTADGLGLQIAGNGTRFGWTPVLDPFVVSTQKPGGLCAYPQVVGPGGAEAPVPNGQSADRVIFTTNQTSFQGASNLFGIVHPNERGQDLYRTSLIGPAQRVAGVPVAAPTVDVKPTPTPTPTPTPIPTPQPPVLQAPTSVSAKNLAKATKKHRHVRISFTPAAGERPYAFKVRVKVPGRSASTIRDVLKKNDTIWKQAPKGQRVKIRVGAFTKSPQRLVWGDWITLRVRR